MDSKVVNFSVYSKPHGEPCAEIYTLLITIDIRFMHMLLLGFSRDNDIFGPLRDC
jgi:hypothetical protein